MNTGKYHYKFYLLCDSETSACVRLRAHTKNSSDVGDAHPQSDSEVDKDKQVQTSDGNDEDIGKLSAIIFDMCQVLERKGHVVNIDNYYTNPTAVMELRRKKIFIRGTVRKNKVLFPKNVLFSKVEARDFPRGGPPEWW